jgi:TonB family protein
VERQEPEYSQEARIAKLEGAVMLAVVVGEDGRARNLRVVKPLGLGLDENAVTAVSRWRFAPGTKAGEAVAVQAQIEVNFRLLLDPREWRLARASFRVPPGASRPMLLHAQYGPAAGRPEDASVRIAFDVDAQGIPGNIQVEESSDPKWNDEVIALIREWRFQAALDNGTAVPSHALFDLSRGLAPVLAPNPAAPPQKKR